MAPHDPKVPLAPVDDVLVEPVCMFKVVRFGWHPCCMRPCAACHLGLLQLSKGGSFQIIHHMDCVSSSLQAHRCLIP